MRWFSGNYVETNVTVQHPHLTSPIVRLSSRRSRGGGNVFPPPLVGGVRGGGELIQTNIIDGYDYASPNLVYQNVNDWQEVQQCRINH